MWCAAARSPKCGVGGTQEGCKEPFKDAVDRVLVVCGYRVLLYPRRLYTHIQGFVVGL